MLFERTKRSVMLTPLGREMVGLAKEVVARLDDLKDVVRAAGAPLAGDLRIGVIPTIGPFLLPRVLYLREEQTESLSLVKTSSANVGRQIAGMQRHNSCTRTAATVFP